MYFVILTDIICDKEFVWDSNSCKLEILFITKGVLFQ